MGFVRVSCFFLYFCTVKNELVYGRKSHLRKGIIWNRYQILELYMILGGIPYYLDMLEKGLPYAQNIDNLFYRLKITSAVTSILLNANSFFPKSLSEAPR